MANNSPPMITSLQNPLVKQIRQLHQAKYRHRYQQLLLEGTHLITEACAVNYPIEIVCFTPAWDSKNPILSQQLQTLASRCEVVSAPVLATLATTQNPDGVIAVAPRQVSKSLQFETLGLVLEGIQDPGNLGTILRTAAAVGVDGILLGPGCVDLDHPKVLRATAGQWFRLNFSQETDLKTALTQYGTNPAWQIIATRPSSTACSYWDWDYRRKTIFILGSEGQGLSPEIMTQAQHEVYIPQAAGVESLNVAIAAALLLYEAKRQRTERAFKLIEK